MKENSIHKFSKLKKEERLHQVSMPIIAITGGIASGKSTASRFIKSLGHPVINADDLIHNIYEQKETKTFLKEIAPESVSKDDGINFSVLREKFFKDTNLKKRLEEFLYQRLPQEFHNVLPTDKDYVFYDVPLLFEKGLNYKVDAIIVVSSSKENQLKRLALRDPQSTPETNENIIKQQWPLAKKEDMADIVLINNGSEDDLERSVKTVLSELF